MPRTIYFISHPNVEISSTQPVTQWSLSATGQARMHRLLKQDWIADITAVYCSTEQKAVDGAEILARHLNVSFRQLDSLGENDRTATGYLAADEFEQTADRFFAEPETSVRGWETAIAAQRRIVDAVRLVEETDTTPGDIAIISHGAVGTLLYCFAAKKSIDRCWDQPGTGGGNYLRIGVSPPVYCDWWQPIDS